MSANPSQQPNLPFQLIISTANRRTLLQCSGRLIAGTTEYFLAEARRVAEWSDVLVLDLGGLTYMDSSGLGAVVSVFTSVRRAGRDFQLRNVTPRVMELLQITKLVKVLQPTDENLL